MPMVLIEIAKQYSSEQEIKLMNAVKLALMEAFKVTDHAINIRLMVEANRENWGILGGHAGCDMDVGYAVEV